MVGMGETPEEVVEAMQLLRDADVDLLTLGQYLQPTSKHLPISSFPEPSQFEKWASQAEKMGFKGVASGPLVRSSFKAGILLHQARARNDEQEGLGEL